MELSVEQKQVFDYRKSQVCIAGPGSGKTRVLTSLAEDLYNEGRDLICLTFTRAAAQEMRNRMPGIKALTLHSYAYHEVGWQEDYDDMLRRAKHSDKFEWILVDECQDLTLLQWQLIGSLLGPSSKIFLVGDFKQSIFGWAGALGERLMIDLEGMGLEKTYLKENYRSNQKIVDRLNTIYPRDLISKGPREIGKSAVLVRNRKQVEEVKEILLAHSIPFTVKYGASETDPKAKLVSYGSDTLMVQTVHTCKGLEYDNVVLWGGELNDLCEFEERNVWYVAVSRASQEYHQATRMEYLLKFLRVKEAVYA